MKENVMKKSLTLNEIINLNNGIGFLDGYEKPIKEGDNFRAIRASYVIASGTRLMLALNMNLIRPFIDAYQKTLNDLRLVKSNNKGEVLGKELLEFNRENQALLNNLIDVDLRSISVAELKLEVNDIPSSVIVMLLPILTDL